MSTATLDLFKAVEVNDMPGVKAAITAGADITAKNAQGKTPADLAVDRGHFIIAHFLLSQRAPGTAPSRTAQPKPTEPKPRNLTPAPKKPTAAAKREPRTVPQPLQSARRFSPPPEKPAPETPDPAADLPPEPARAMTPPPLKTAQTKSRFTTPPRKPPRPMPNAVDVTSAPGSGVDVPPAAMPAPGDPGAATLPPGALSDTALSEVPAAEPATDVTVLPAQLPADADAGLPPELSTPAPRAAPPGASETAQAPPAAAARPAPSTSAAPLGKVGQFFRNLVDMVTPDGPDRPPASAQAGRITEVPANRAATARTPSQAGRAAAAAPEVAAPSADDARLAQDLARSLGLEDAAAPAPSADVLPMKDIEGAGASAPRQVQPPPDTAIRRSVPAPQVTPSPVAPPAGSTASRTLDRIEDLVADKPKEDEFGLPSVEITGSPSEALPAAEPAPAMPQVMPPALPEAVPQTMPPARTAAKAAQPTAPPASDEPTLESLLGDAPAKSAAKSAGAPNIDDAPGRETNLPVAIDEEVPDRAKSAPKAAPALGARPAQPVTTAQSMSDAPNGKLQYMSTTERLRRLNEALSREVPLDTPARRNLPTLTDRMTDYMITGKSPATPKATSGMPPSSLPTRPLSQRDGPSDRFIDRLERIRRNAYEEEAEATPAPTTPTPARAPAEAPRNASAPAAPAAPAPAADTKGEDTVLSKLVKFFRQADGKKAEARPEPKAVPRPKTGAEAITVPQTAYRTAPDIGPAKGELPSPAPLSPEALAATGKETEPQPGQSAGKMPPGFLDHLSQLFTDQKVAEKGWAAEVEILEPKQGKPPEQTMMPVAPSKAPAGAPSAGSAPMADTAQRRMAAAPEPALPPPSGDLPADAGAAWTTTVEMTTDTGDPMVLGVVKTPVPQTAPRRAPAASPTQTAQAQPRRSESLPPPQSGGENVVINDDGLPPPQGEAGGENLVINDDGLPPAQGEAPLLPADDLPPARGKAPRLPTDDLPPAQGERMAAAKPAAPAQPAAPEPYSDPLQRPMPKPAAAPSAPPPLSRTAELRSGPDSGSPVGGETRLRPDERLATSPSEPATGQTMGDPSQPWRVTDLAKTDAPPPRQQQDRPEMLSRTSMTGVNLSLGDSVTLENTLPPGGGTDANNRCVKKNRGTTLFCIEPVDWPEDLKPKFVVPTILYTGPMAIVRYDQGTASRLRALFPSAEFESVVQYYQKRYGPPTEIWKRSIAPLAQPRRDNPTVAWRNRDPKTNAVTILELRRYDDTRGGFPDTQRGAVMLYLANSPTIFPQVSSHELMRLKRDTAASPPTPAEG